MTLSNRLKSRMAAKKKKTKRSPEQRLVDAADHEGLTCEDFARHKDLCRKHRINQTRLTGALVHRAHELHRKQIQETIERLARLYHQRGAPEPDSESEAQHQKLAAIEGQTKKKKRKPATTGSTQRIKIFDHPVTAVLRWMGKHNWNVKDAMHVVQKLGAKVAKSTCNIQVKAGKTGDRGAPAKLTRDQIKQLKELKP
jgi:hypothetical protein